MKRTGLTEAQMKKLRARDHNTCVLTGIESDRLVPQHRRNRGIGGDRTMNTLENTLLVDSILNGRIEAEADIADIAKVLGIKVPIWVKGVAAVPVFYAHEHRWFLLEGNGRRVITAEDAIDRMRTIYGDEYFQWKALADRNPHAGIYAMRTR